ncbi:MAG TPA: chorismate mutase [Solirubrobacteraceae bacterium]|jgi:chorismate mutase
MSGLDEFRGRIDEIDGELLRLLGERFGVCREVAQYKREHQIDVMQPQRVQEVRARYLQQGGEANLPIDFTEALCELLIDASCRLEDELVREPASEPEE